MTADIITLPNVSVDLDQQLPQFPEVWDSTIRAAFANCQRKGYWEFIRNKRKSGSNIHLLFGGCFAKGMEIARRSFYERGLSQPDAITEAILAATDMWERHDGDDLVPQHGTAANKTYAALVDAIDSYFERWSMEDDEIVPLRLPSGDLFIEKTFAFPVDGTSHPLTNNPIIYAGRLDMLGEWKSAGVYIGVDEKTSTQLGNAWAASWTMRGQLHGYMRGSAEYGFKIRHFHIRGVGILSKDITFAENLQNREDWQIDAWYTQLRKDINRAADTYKLMCTEQERNGFDLKGLHDHWDQNFDSVCSSYGGCSYMDLCTTQNPERYLHNFDDTNWDPLSSRD